MQNLNKKTFSIILLSVVVLLVIFSPTLAQGKEKITNIWAGTGNASSTCNERGMTCTFCDGIIVTTNIIELLLLLGVTLGVLIILYGGVRLMTSGGSQTQIKEAKDIIVKAIIGVVIVSCAWIIVDTIFKTFAKDSKWNALDFIGCGSSDLKIATKGTTGGDMKFSPRPATQKEIAEMENQTEGTEILPISVCKKLPQGMLQKYTTRIFPFTAHAGGYGDNVIAYAEYYKKSLFYSNETNARTDIVGTTKQCKKIKGKWYGCADCSGFVYAIYGCSIGIDLSILVKENERALNTTILGKMSVEDQGLERYWAANYTDEEFTEDILKPGDLIGYDYNCRNQATPKEPPWDMGHVMIFKKIIIRSENDWEIKIIHQGSTGGAVEETINDKHFKAWKECGYIIHIPE